MTIFIIIFALFSGYIIYQVKIKKVSIKSLIRKEFYGLEFTDNKLAFNLFRYHHPNVDKVFNVNEINQCQILLGNSTIATINSTIGYGFNAFQEKKLRDIFHDEQVTKMVDGKVRRISLVIRANGKEIYVICLYLRKGSDRITKNSYCEVVDNTIDWCWYFSNILNNKETGQRTLKAKIITDNIIDTEHQRQNDIPINNNQAETSLLYDLEKIVELKQQGFLTPEEFTQAKAVLLNDLDKTTH